MKDLSDKIHIFFKDWLKNSQFKVEIQVSGEKDFAGKKTYRVNFNSLILEG